MSLASVGGQRRREAKTPTKSGPSQEGYRERSREKQARIGRKAGVKFLSHPQQAGWNGGSTRVQEPVEGLGEPPQHPPLSTSTESSERFHISPGLKAHHIPGRKLGKPKQSLEPVHQNPAS